MSELNTLQKLKRRNLNPGKNYSLKILENQKKVVQDQNNQYQVNIFQKRRKKYHIQLKRDPKKRKAGKNLHNTSNNFRKILIDKSLLNPLSRLRRD